MEFLWPVMLYGLLVVPLALWGYLRLLRLRERAAVAYADPHLFERLMRRARPLQRHLPVALYLAAVALLVLAAARPVAAIPLPVNRAAVVLVIDTSKSMLATDTKPSRIEAAKDAAGRFLRTVTGSAAVGLVSFSDYATVLVKPTTDRQALLDAIERLKAEQATAIGSAIVTAVRALPGRSGAGIAVAPGQPQPPGVPAPTGEPPADLPPGAVIVFSDGVSNIGADALQAAEVARRWRVTVYTVSVGTPGGGIVTLDGQNYFAPFSPDLLQRIADTTGGRYFAGPDNDDLRRIYGALGRVMGWESKRTEVTAVVTGGATLVMLLGAGLSLVWFRRVP